jgi:hypothetical protein
MVADFCLIGNIASLAETDLMSTAALRQTSVAAFERLAGG